MSAIYAQKYPRRDFYYSHLPTSSRLLISCFYLAMVVAIGMSVTVFHMKTSLKPKVVAEYVRGNDSAAEPASEKMFFAKSKEELGDVSHSHLFIQGILLFILAHLFTLVRLRDKAKSVIIVAGFATYIFGIAAPWLIRYVHPYFSYGQLINLSLMTVVFILMMGVPFWEMWWQKPLNGAKSVVSLSRRSESA